MRNNTYAKLITAAVAIISLLSACEKAGNNNISVTYGTSFGMCAGYCIQSVQIYATTIKYSKSKHQVPDTKTCSRPVEASLIQEVLTMDEAAFNALPATIGCPDCADGGAEYIEINRNGRKRRVTYEFGNAPEVLARTAEKLKPILDSFKDCK